MKRIIIDNTPEENKIINFWTGVIMAPIIIIFLIVFFWTFKTGLEGNERNECLQWQKQATKLRKGLFYLTPEQKAQCDAVGVAIDAPIH